MADRALGHLLIPRRRQRLQFPTWGMRIFRTDREIRWLPSRDQYEQLARTVAL